MRRKPFLSLLPLLFFLLATASPSNVVKMGIYHNPPLSLVDESGQPSGFFVEILDHIAEEEGWQIEYHLCEWEACLQALEAGEIDLLGPIAYSEERSKRFDFSEETLLTNWGQVYVQSGETNISIVDFAGKQIALLDGDIHADVFLSIVDEFGISVEPVYFDSYAEILTAIEKKKVYGGVLNHLFAIQNAPKFDVEKSGIIFNPIEVRFAAPQGQSDALLAALDAQVSTLKNDNDSLFYRSMNFWMRNEFVGTPAISTWILWVAAFAIALTLLLFGLSYYLRRQVEKKTRELKNSREDLALIMDHIPSMIAFVDRDLRYIYVDQAYAGWYGFKKEEVVGKLIEEVLPPKNYEKVRPRLEEMLTSGKELYYEHRIVRRDGREADVAVTYIPKKDSHGKVEAFFATVDDITEEKKAHIALRESEAKYRYLVDNSLIGIFIAKFGQVTFANRGTVELFGYESPEEMIGLSVENLVAPQDLARVVAEGKAKQDGLKQKSQYLFKALRKDGSIFDAEIVSQAIEYEGEHAIQGMIINISDRIEAQERFRSLSEASYEAIFISERGVCLEQNSAAERIFGYSQEEAIGRLGTEWIAEEDRELVMHHMLSGYEEPYRVAALRKDGTTFPCEIVARMMEYKGRKVRVTALRDISSQVTAEESLRESEEKYRNIVENSLEGMFRTTFDGRFLMVNPALARIYGYDSPEELIREVTDIREQLYVNGVARDQMLQAVMRGDELVDLLEQNRRKDGSLIWIKTKARVVRDDEGTPLYIEGFLEDVTERMKADERLRKSKERFEKIIAKAPIPMVIINEEGEAELYNDYFTKVFGYTIDELDDWWGAVYPDEEYRAIVQKDWAKVIAQAKRTGEQVETQRWEMVRKDGQSRIVEFDMVPLGEIFVMVLSDITEQTQAEQVLREREQKLKEAQEIGNMGHWELDLRTDELVWSDQIYRIFDLPPEVFAASYTAFLDAIHPDDREMVAEAYETSLKNKTPYDIVHRLFIGGEVRYVHERCKTEYGEDDTPVRSLGTVQDVTEQVRTEQVMNIRAELAEYALAHTLEELLRKTLDEAENLTYSKIGFYHFINADQKTLSLQQWSSRTVDGYCEVPNLNRHYAIDQAGVWVDCIAEKEPIIHNDYASLKHRKGLPEGHAQLFRELVVPVIRGDKVVAILGVGNKETEYNQKDVEIVSLVADLCWDIAERKITEEALAESKAFLNEAQEIARLGSYRFYINENYWTSNEVLDLIFGIDENYLRSTDGWLKLIHPDDREMMQTYLGEDVIATRQSFDKEYRIVNQATQNTRWVHGLGKLIFDSEEHLLSMAGTIQDITERVTTQIELQRHARQLEIVNAITAALSTSLELDDLLKTILHQVVQVIPCDSAAIFLSETDERLTIVNAIGKAEVYLGQSFGIENTLMQKIKPGQNVLILDDAFNDPDYSRWTDDDNAIIRGWMGLPLHARNTLVGYLTFDSDSPQAFSDSDAALAVAFATQVAQAIYNARLHKDIQDSLQQLQTLNTVIGALSTSLDLVELLELIFEEVAKVLPLDSGAIFLYEDDGLVVVADRGFVPSIVGRNVLQEDELFIEIREKKGPLIVVYALEDPRFKNWGGTTHIESWLGVPLMVREKIIGFMTLDSYQEGVFYTEQDAQLALTFASQAAQAINNARLYERVIADANDLERHVQRRTEELQRFVDLTAGREIRMIELKGMIRELRRQLIKAGHVPVVGELLGDD